VPSDTNYKKQFAKTIRQIISRSLVIFGFIALFAISGIVGIVVYKKAPVEIWGMKIGYQMEENQSKDIPFLITEVQQLKEQSKLLEKRLVKLLNENELQTNQLKECKDQFHLNSKG